MHRGISSSGLRLVLNMIVEADVMTCGLLISNPAENDGDGTGLSQAGQSNTIVSSTTEEKHKIEDGELRYPAQR